MRVHRWTYRTLSVVWYIFVTLRCMYQRCGGNCPRPEAQGTRVHRTWPEATARGATATPSTCRPLSVGRSLHEPPSCGTYGHQRPCTLSHMYKYTREDRELTRWRSQHRTKASKSRSLIYRRPTSRQLRTRPCSPTDSMSQSHVSRQVQAILSNVFAVSLTRRYGTS